VQVWAAWPVRRTPQFVDNSVDGPPGRLWTDRAAVHSRSSRRPPTSAWPARWPLCRLQRGV